MPNGYTTSHIRTSTAGICSQIGWSEKGSQIYSASEKHYSKPPIEWISFSVNECLHRTIDSSNINDYSGICSQYHTCQMRQLPMKFQYYNRQLATPENGNFAIEYE